VHCKRGADRTGAIIAAYRMEHGKWDNSKALQEAMANGMSSFQILQQKYIRNFKPRTKDTVRAAVSDTPPASEEVKTAAVGAR
jgi:protein-tyrosine phosphatase